MDISKKKRDILVRKWYSCRLTQVHTDRWVPANTRGRLSHVPHSLALKA